MERITIILTALLAAASVSAQEAPSQQAASVQQIAKTADANAKRGKSNAGKATAGKTNDSKATTASAADAKTLAGISILGNQEAPKSLVIVPWKGSEIGDMPGLSRLLDDSVQPVDKDVFMRELSYYEIRSGKPESGKQ